ncbi:uncharacterized protein LOC142984412 [Anticarsia gemmatalis]|uniref:uncharacterized protein LOC142984412 n=1 Tax=Anticarsia gemmatalis TaxID=129554 RepID=UPI003F7738C9
MGISTNSHGKSDKETQSPLLKIFKDIMMRENNDPEKRNLLTDQRDDKKRRQYSGSRLKNDRSSIDSHSTGHRKRSPYKMMSSDVYPSKQESWWNWAVKTETKAKPADDTCSCGSCVLKRIMGSEYACVGCLLLVFFLSIIGACTLVCRTLPSTEVHKTAAVNIRAGKHGVMDSERLKRKIDLINDSPLRNELGDGYDKPLFDSLKSDPMEFQGSSGIDFGPSFRELNSLEEGDSKLGGESYLPNMLEPDKMEGNSKLRDFYEKLVQTDTKIQNLRRLTPIQNIYSSYDNKTPDRTKRTLKLYNYPQNPIRRRRDTYSLRNKPKRRNKIVKRHGNGTDDVTGFVIEKKKLIVQYKPLENLRKVPKCSHVPDLHHHEHHLKHPFYKNTQKLDELLDRFLNKNLPEIMSDPFGLDTLFQARKNACKHPKPIKNIDIITKDGESNIRKTTKVEVKSKSKYVTELHKATPATKPIVVKFKTEDLKLNKYTPSDIQRLLKPEPTTKYFDKYYMHTDNTKKEKQKMMTQSPDDFEVVLSVSTIMNPEIHRTGKATTLSLLDKVPNLRRLLQLEEEEEGAGYEDFKEVLTDEDNDLDDVDKGADRKKRHDMDLTYPGSQESHAITMLLTETPGPKEIKYNPPGVQNPNWKGPMPLYPDELNSMIRHAAMAANETKLKQEPKTEKQINRKRKSVSDIEYVENYLDNKYDKLVEMAQAYSDYGVLEDKKESQRNEKNPATDGMTGNQRMSDEQNFFRRGLLAQDSKEQYGIFNSTFIRRPGTEGFRLELRPTTASRDDIEIAKILDTHIKIEDPKEKFSNNMKFSKRPDEIKNEHFDVSLPKRTLLSTLFRKDNFIKKYLRKANLISDNNNEMGIQDKPKYVNKYAPNYGPKKPKDKDRLNDYIVEATQSNIHMFATPSIYNSFLEMGKTKPDNGPTLVVSKAKSMTHPKDLKQKPNINLKLDSKAEIDLTKDFNFHTNLEYVTHKTDFLNTDLKMNFGLEQPAVDKTMLAEIESLLKSNSDKDKVNTDIYSNMSKWLDSNDFFVKIENSELKPVDFNETSYEGSISLTLQSPENLGIETMQVKFNVPLLSSVEENLDDIIDKMVEPDSLGKSIENMIKPSVPNTQKHKRSKREIAIDISPENTTTATSINVTELAKTSTENASKEIANITTKAPENKVNVSIKNDSIKASNFSDINIADIFMIVADWFKALGGMDVDLNKTSRPPKNIAELVSSFNNISRPSAFNKTSTTDSAYPLYDSDMIENIDHRSRVLLSIKEENMTDSESRNEMQDTKVTGVKSANVSTNVSSTTATPTNLKPNNTTPDKDGDTKPHEKKRDDNRKKVKRNADDSNLIFWNDIYDDEYGIQADNLDGVIRDKYSKDNDFIKRSGRWVQEKFKKFTNNLKGQNSEDTVKKRMPRDVTQIEKYPQYIYNKISGQLTKRDSQAEEGEIDQKAVFNALATNMMQVCKKAAKAVKQTREIPTKPDTKQSAVATSLMQQLVRLLTDLVDYQVQQKTCTQLPPDLHSFLEWLTIPGSEGQEEREPDAESVNYKTTLPYPEEDVIDELVDLTTMEPNTEYLTTSEKMDYKSQYLDTVQSVQDLLDQYEEMGDEEKSKMTGIKFYLQNQMRYLNKQIPGHDLYNLFEKSSIPLRYRRDLSLKGPYYHHILRRFRPKLRLERKTNKFLKNFGKKHTRTTAGYYDGIPVTEKKKRTEDSIIENRIPKENIKENSPKELKRNLQDVYYKAVAEAKKYTATAKIGHKKQKIASTTEHIH